MTINPELLHHIKSYCNKNPSVENCGFIVEDAGELIFLPVINKHPDSVNYFVISPRDYLDIKQKYKIKYLFHNHKSEKFFSNVDIYYQKYHNMNMLLYVLDSGEFKEIKCK